jgi:hypothetical protein
MLKPTARLARRTAMIGVLLGLSIQSEGVAV